MIIDYQNNRDGQVIDDESKEGNDNVKKDTHCKYYFSGKCNHGRKGQGCPYTHPKLCFNFLKKGATGCKKSDFEYTHPKLCKYSVSDKMCRRRKCHFYHLWGTKRPNIETNYQGDNNHISDYNQEEHKPYRKPANLNNNARPQQNRYDLQSGERYDFLEEFAQILQEKLSVYYQQAERKPLPDQVSEESHPSLEGKASLNEQRRVLTEKLCSLITLNIQGNIQEMWPE